MDNFQKLSNELLAKFKIYLLEELNTKILMRLFNKALKINNFILQLEYYLKWVIGGIQNNVNFWHASSLNPARQFLYIFLLGLCNFT